MQRRAMHFFFPDIQDSCRMQEDFWANVLSLRKLNGNKWGMCFSSFLIGSNYGLLVLKIQEPLFELYYLVRTLLATFERIPILANTAWIALLTDVILQRKNEATKNFAVASSAPLGSGSNSLHFRKLDTHPGRSAANSNSRVVNYHRWVNFRK